MNTNVLAVDLSRIPVTAAQVMRRQLASVPALFREDPSVAEIIVVDGASSSWPATVESALARSTTRGIMLIQLGSCAGEDVDRVADLIGRSDLPVVVPCRLAGTAAWRTAVPEVRATLDETLVVECVSRVPNSDRTDWALGSLVEQLTLLGSVWGPISTLKAGHLSADRYVVAGTYDGVRIGLIGTRSAPVAASMEAEFVGLDHRWVVKVSDDVTARPATVEHYTPSGVTSARPVFESAGRSAWINLHDRVHNGAPPRYPDFRTQAEHLRNASALLGGGRNRTGEDSAAS